MKKRAVGYCRISTLMQVDNTSLKDQEDKIKMYAKLHDIVIDKIFIDKAVSGKSTDRPEYDNMMEHIKKSQFKENKIDMIIVYKNDRIHRSLYNLLAMIYELQEQEVALVSVTEMFDTSTPQGMLFLQMLGSFAEFERAIINERTRNGRIARLNENKWVGGKPSLGYKVNKYGQFEIDEEEAKIVKDIFKLRSKGLSLSKIGDKYGFSKQKVDYILKNKNYIGVFEYIGKKEKNDIIIEIEAIVSKYMWNKVNRK
ncbi:MAG: recombinase family protein [Clostridia bacterium]